MKTHRFYSKNLNSRIITKTWQEMREQPGRVCLGVMMGVGEWYQRGGDPKSRRMILLSRGEEKQSDILFVGLGSLCEFRLAFIAGMINCLQYSICSGGERERGKRRAELWSLCSRSVGEAFHYSAFNLMHTPFFYFSFFLQWRAADFLLFTYLLAYFNFHYLFIYYCFYCFICIYFYTIICFSM